MTQRADFFIIVRHQDATLDIVPNVGWISRWAALPDSMLQTIHHHSSHVCAPHFWQGHCYACRDDYAWDSESTLTDIDD